MRIKEGQAGYEVQRRKRGSRYFPTPTTEREKKILQYVRAAFRKDWTRGWSEDQRLSCIAEAYLEAAGILAFCDDEATIKRIVNATATPLKNHEAREGLHTPYFTRDEEGREVAIPDLAGKGSSLDVDDLLRQIDADLLARKPIPAKARRYKLTPREVDFVYLYQEGLLTKTPAVRKRFSRLLKKQRAYFTYYAGFMWLYTQDEARRKREAHQKTLSQT